MPDPIQGVNTALPIGGASATGQSNAAQGNGKPADAAAGPAADTADVGRTATLLTTIAEAAGQAPGIDEAKVAELRQAIAAGTYQVDPQKIAGKLLDLEAGPTTVGGGR